MRLLQRIRGGGSRTDSGSEQWAPEGEGKGCRRGQTAREAVKAEYLRRDSRVSGEECDGTLLRGFRESGIKQGGTAGNSLSLYQGQVFCLGGYGMPAGEIVRQRHFN